jgi:class 3 adenylate cyclase
MARGGRLEGAMSYERSAVHQTIFAVGVDGFGDRRRTDVDRLAVRAGMYRALSQAFDEAGVPWADCYRTDLGDGVLVLAPPEIPKGLFVDSLPAAIAAVLHRNNRSCGPGTQIRLRMALHAGEVVYGDSGVTSPAISHTFRLLGAAPLSSALRASPGVLALITSAWFFDEVVRHSGDLAPAMFQRVVIVAKETSMTGWISLPDVPRIAIERVLERAAGAERSEYQTVIQGNVYNDGRILVAGPSPVDQAATGIGLGSPPHEETTPAQERVTPAGSGSPPPQPDDPAGGVPTDAGATEVPRFLHAGLPSRAPMSATVSLVVQITAAAPSWSRRSSVLAGLVAGQEVLVVVQAPAGLVPEGPLEQITTVPPRGDGKPVRFGFRTREAGRQRLQVSAWAGGTFLADLEIEVAVGSGSGYGSNTRARARMSPPRSRAGEATLLVRSDGDRHVFQLLSEECVFEPVVARTLTGDPGMAVERAVTMLKQLAEGRGPYGKSSARRWMRETGIGLWNDVVPEVIKDQYWQLRRNITSLSVATTDDLLPWELLYPLRQDADEGFLVEQFPVLRRVFGQRRAREVDLGDCSYVLSSHVPGQAQEEIDAVSGVLGPGSVIDSLDQLLDLIGSGRCGALHFACHNSFAADGGGSSIKLDGGPFVPTLLNSAATTRSLAERSPLVFINACRSAGAVPQFGRMLGWAQQFMAAGAGAFVGTLWPVRSETAAGFACTFYEQLHAGHPLGEAAHLARRSTGTGDVDPTWLAYAIYGDPAATATGRAKGRFG